MKNVTSGDATELATHIATSFDVSDTPAGPCLVRSVELLWKYRDGDRQRYPGCLLRGCGKNVWLLAPSTIAPLWWVARAKRNVDCNATSLV